MEVTGTNDPVAAVIAGLPIDMRVAVPADAETICRYHHAAWLAGLHHLFPAGALDDSDPLEKLDRWQSWLQPDSDLTTIVVERDGHPVGHTTVRGNELVHLFIDPQWFGNGFGSSLLAVGESLLAAAGHIQILLHTLVGNERAVALYTNRGWEMTDELTPGVYFGYDRDEHTLIKTLDG